MGRQQSSSPEQQESEIKQQELKNNSDISSISSKKKKNKLDVGLERQQKEEASRPRRRATNQHIFRYLQTRNPTKLEENDLKRALEASLEECPDFWPEDTASCSSSEQSNATSSSTNSSTGNSIEGNNRRRANNNNMRCISHLNHRSVPSTSKRRSTKSMQQNHLTCSNPYNHSPHNHHHQNHHQFNNQHHLSACCPLSSVHNRYKPVAKKNIYDEADFFHEGIMEYIDHELRHSWSNKKHKNKLTSPKQVTMS